MSLDQQKAYDEICISYRSIDDFRAKLLGFLPLATWTGIFLLFNKIPNATQDIKYFVGAIGVFGFSSTLGLFLYEIMG
jgi:hypothetical protein